MKNTKKQPVWCQLIVTILCLMLTGVQVGAGYWQLGSKEPNLRATNQDRSGYPDCDVNSVGATCTLISYAQNVLCIDSTLCCQTSYYFAETGDPADDGVLVWTTTVSGTCGTVERDGTTSYACTGCTSDSRYTGPLGGTTATTALPCDTGS